MSLYTIVLLNGNKLVLLPWLFCLKYSSLFFLRSDPSASNERFPSTSGSTLAAHKEPCRNQEEQLNAERQKSPSWTSEYSDRKEVLKLLNQGKPFKSETAWDNQTFDSSPASQAEDTRKRGEGSEEIREDSDCSGRSREESESSEKSQTRTRNSETPEEPKTSDSDASKNQSVPASDLSDSSGVSYSRHQTVCWTLSDSLSSKRCASCCW